MSDPYLYYNSIKDTPVCGQLDFYCLKLKYDPIVYPYSIHLGMCCFNSLWQAQVSNNCHIHL